MASTPVEVPTVLLWGVGALTTLAMTLALVLLARVQKQGDDTNAKVTSLGERLARIDTSADSTSHEVGRLRDNFHRLNNAVMKLAGAREMAQEIAGAFREGDRRSSQRRPSDDLDAEDRS